MSWLRPLLIRLQPLFRRRQIEAELADELRSHLEFATEAHLAAGLSPAEARRAAQRELGGVEQIKESYRDQRGLPWLDQLHQDLRAAVRSLRKTPGFTAVAILALAVAIGVNTTVFSLVNGFLLRPLAPLRSHELVTPYLSEEGIGYRPFTHAEYLSLRSARDTFADVAATFPTFASVADANGLHRGVAFFASENYFSMLGVTPQLGRFFTAEECRPNANLRVLVASYAFWQRFGGRADFVGSTLRVNGQLYTVVGVAPPTFDGLNVIIATDCWAPLGVFSTFGGSAFGQGTPDLAVANSYSLFLTARLAPGLTLKSAASRLPAVVLQFPKAAHPLKLEVARPDRQNVGPFPVARDPTVALSISFLSISACVLLIAGFNLGNMLLARGADRAKEIAVRTALGATRGRIVRQLLTEGLLLALAGGALGFLFTLWANRLLYAAGNAMNASFYSLALNLRPDLRVFAATVSCSLFATLVFSFFPALKASRVDLVQDLKRQGGETASTHRLGRFFAWRHVLLMFQVALSLAVLFIAALFARSALAAGRAPLGFDPSGGTVVELDFSLNGTPFPEVQRALSSAIARARTQPGVIAAAATTLLPYGNMGAAKSLEATDSAARSFASVAKVIANYAAITPGYFDALGVRLLRGRDFTPAEASDPTSAYVAIIDEGLAHRLFPNSDALGQRIRERGQAKYAATPSASAAPEYKIVGLCSLHRHELQAEDQASFYVPFAAKPDHRGSIYLQVRYASENPALLSASLAPLRLALLAGNADLPLTQVTPFAQLIGQHAPLWMARVGAVLLGSFGAIALLLAVTGIYCVKSYAVARRTREIGIRVALGASPRAAFLLIFRQAVLQIALALLVGSALELAAGRMLGGFVYRISGTDPLALVAAGLLLALAALLACWLPAHRATRVDPMIALRCE
jgi:putative ABC transport system permease protein